MTERVELNTYATREAAQYQATRLVAALHGHGEGRLTVVVEPCGDGFKLLIEIDAADDPSEAITFLLNTLSDAAMEKFDHIEGTTRADRLVERLEDI